MKKILTTLSLLLFIALGNIQAVVGVNTNENLNEVYGIDFNQEISMDAFLHSSIKDIQRKTGKKLKLKDKLALLVAKRQMKKMQKKGATLEELKSEADGGGSNFHFLSFLLGFLLGLLGVLIVYLVWKDKRRTRSSWLGVLTIVIIAVLGAVL